MTRRAALGTFTAALLTVAGCGNDTSTPKAAAAQKVTALTGFGMIGQDAYLVLGRDLGYFREQGIDLQLQPGKGTADNLKVLLAGQAQFATIDLTGALIAHGKSVKGFTVVAAVYQRSVSSITALDGSGITHPSDLHGKRIGYAPGGVNFMLFPAYARLAGIDATKVTWQQVDPAQMRGLLAAGKLDAITETVIGTPGVESTAKGRKAVVLAYNDWVTDLYGNVIAAKTGTDPELVRRFRTAALKSLTYAIDHPAEAGTAFHQANPTYPQQAATAETALMASYVRAGAGEVGGLESGRVARSIALLQGLGAIPAGITPDAVVDFTAATGWKG
ncbi:MAG TPA: ABC transporter substrate-binding protein [Catenuloplanes sp.]